MKSAPKVGGEERLSGGGWVALFRRDEGRWRYEWLMASSSRPERGRTADSADERALVQMEKDWAAAMVKADTKALETILAPDWVASFEGVATSRPQFLAALRTGAVRFEVSEGSEEEAFVFGDTAVVLGLVRLKGTSGRKAVRWAEPLCRLVREARRALAGRRGYEHSGGVSAAAPLRV